VALDLARVPVLPVFKWLAKAGNIAEPELLRTFNCGVGMIALAAADQADKVIAVLKREGENAFPIGTVTTANGEPRVTYSGHLDLA
ncbi:MAG: AIR synthase-related protein, partial [Pseudolabrys sp.]